MTQPTSASGSLPQTLVCFALKEEVGAFRRTAAAEAGVSILVTGIGKKNSEESLRQFLDKNGVNLVLTCGFAGGLNPELRSGAVVFATEDASLSQRLSTAGAGAATFFCASRIATTVSEKQELRRATGADAVEMESDAIHAICRERKIPCATVRVISDTAQENMPLDFNQLAKPDLNLHPGKLALAIARSPGKIPALLRLQKTCRQAAANLARVLEKFIAAR